MAFRAGDLLELGSAAALVHTGLMGAGVSFLHRVVERGIWMKNGLLPALAASMALAGCADLHMRAPDAPVDAIDQVEMTGIDLRDAGSFNVAGNRGNFVRGDARFRSGAAIVHEGDVAFALAGRDVEGRVDADCGHSAIDIGSDSLSIRSSPVTFRCQFLRNGAPIDARLEINEKRALGDRREGVIFYRGHRIALRSVHDSPQLRVRSGTPLGYMFLMEEREIGGVDINDSSQRVYLPRDPALREAALVAAIALTLFQDPDQNDEAAELGD